MNNDNGTIHVRFSRSDYLVHKCTHEEYYGQFCNQETRRRVLTIASPAVIADKLAVDKNLNNIPLERWDIAAARPWPATIANAFREAGDYITAADAVCLLKEQARQMAEEWLVVQAG